MKENNLKATMEKIPGWVYIGLMGIVLVILKLPHLNIPYYWDEAYPFSHAVSAMYENGPRLLPDAIDTELSKGHPLLFYFLAALWMKVFGTSLIAVKSFPMLLSVALLFAVYGTGKKLVSKSVGIVAALFVAVMSVFYVQSSFLVLEVQVTLLTIGAFYFWLKDKYLLYIISGSMLLLTKESGLVAVASVGLLSLIDFFGKSNKQEMGMAKRFLRIVYAGLPILVASIYFIIQKMMHGWFLSPVHVGFMSFSKAVILDKLNSIIQYFFIGEGRAYLLLSLAVSMIAFYVIKKQALKPMEKRIVLLFSVFIVGFIIFSSLNFLSSRYLLCMMPPFAILTSMFIYRAFENKKVLFAIAVVIPVVAMTHSTYKKNGHGDVDRGFEDVVSVFQQMTHYCEDAQMHHDHILAHFLMRISMTSPYAGYLNNPQKPFLNMHYKLDPEVEFCIFSDVEYEAQFDSIRVQYHLDEVKSFKQNTAWCTLYRISERQGEADQRELRVLHYELQIRQTPEWLNDVEKKAKEKNISLDDMIRLDAEYMVAEEEKKALEN